MAKSLTQHQVDFFRRTGYLKLPLRIEGGLVESAIEALEGFTSRPIAPFRTDARGAVERFDAIYQREEVFRQLFTLPELLDCLEGLLGPNIVFVLNRHNHATFNRSGSNQMRLHRDILQWSRGLVTALIFLEPSTLENGCTWLVPTSQYLPFVGTPNNGGTWMDEHSIFGDLLEQSLPCPMPAGSVLLFDSLVFHTVGNNSGPSTRTSLAGGYRSVDELDPSPQLGRIELVRGQYLYRGNDS